MSDRVRGFVTFVSVVGLTFGLATTATADDNIWRSTHEGVTSQVWDDRVQVQASTQGSSGGAQPAGDQAAPPRRVPATTRGPSRW